MITFLASLITTLILALPTAPSDTFTVQSSGDTLPKMITLEWDPNDPAEQVTKYVVELDGLPLNETASTFYGMIIKDYRTYKFGVRAVNATGIGPAATLDYTVQDPGPTIRIVSPDNALAPPLPDIVDSTGQVWTLGPAQETLRNGVQVAGGRGTKLLWHNAKVYTFGLDDSWYLYEPPPGADGWIRLNTVLQPGTIVIPPPPPAPTVEQLQAEITRLNALLVSERTALLNTIEGLNRQLTQLNTEKASLQSQLNAAVNALAPLQVEVSTLQAALNTATARITAIKADVQRAINNFKSNTSGVIRNALYDAMKR